MEPPNGQDDGAGVSASYHDLPDRRQFHALSDIAEVPSESGGPRKRNSDEQDFHSRFPTGVPRYNTELESSGFYSGSPQRRRRRSSAGTQSNAESHSIAESQSLPSRSQSLYPSLYADDETDDFWMSDSTASEMKPESAFTKLLRERAASDSQSGPGLHNRNRPDQDISSVRNATLSRPVRLNQGRQAQSNNSTMYSVENVDPSGDIFASYREERDQRERTQSQTQTPAPPVSILDQGSRSLSRDSVYRRVGGRMTPVRPRATIQAPLDPQQLPQLVRNLRISGTPQSLPVTSESATAKKSANGRPISAKNDPLDFGVQYQSYEKALAPCKYFANSDPLRYKEQYGATDDLNDESYGEGSSAQLPDAPRPSMETAVYRPSTPADQMYRTVPSERTERSSSFSPHGETATHDGSESFDFDDIIEDRHPRRINGPGSYDSNYPFEDEESLNAPANDEASAHETGHEDSSWISRDIGRELGEGLYPPGNYHGLSDPFTSPDGVDRTPRGLVAESAPSQDGGDELEYEEYSATGELLRHYESDVEATAVIRGGAESWATTEAGSESETKEPRKDKGKGRALNTNDDDEGAAGPSGAGDRQWAEGSAFAGPSNQRSGAQVPGCTSSQPGNKNWRMTATALQAYTAMRGSVAEVGHPLGAWMGEQAKEYLEGGGRGTADQKRLYEFATEIGEAQMERPLVMQEDRIGAVNIPRPRYDHLSLPVDHDHPPLAAAGREPGLSFAEQYDISDEEGDPESGRISPCTFRLLAEGCQRWDAGEEEARVELPANLRRTRPETPEDPYAGRNVPNRLMPRGQLQRDEETGGWMSPAYSVESNPSLLYTAAPHIVDNRMPRWENGMYDRMDPEGARTLHNLEVRGPPSYVPTHDTAPTADFEQQDFTAHEVIAAVISPQSRIVHGHHPQMAQAAMANSYQFVGFTSQQEAAFAVQNNVTRENLAKMETELRNVRLCVDHILLDRREQEEEQEEAQRRLARKNRRIMRKMSRHLRDLRWQMEVSQERLNQEAREAERLQYELQVAHAQLQAEADRAGLPNVEAVKAAAGEEFLQLLGQLLD
ncbi:hypothetical protein F5X68DRAFT_255596 [Plectosphaerella plurivora]|uniref:Uncharacterized protein n=1 Tax=Plectosphaerella plurivora TaxID=936078 RepID=A0A9P8VDQ6_9PEZI|nr:hypothetical protein F5X68DRAFT_255596 [Plectosphaerella plurivora]